MTKGSLNLSKIGMNLTRLKLNLRRDLLVEYVCVWILLPVQNIRITSSSAGNLFAVTIDTWGILTSYEPYVRFASRRRAYQPV